jgi:chemotaxis-related protein WspD
MVAGEEAAVASAGSVVNECWREIGVAGDRSCPELQTHLHCRNCPTHAEIARGLLDRPLPAGYREEWALRFAERAQDGDAAEELRRIIIFRLGAEWLGLPTEICHEVAELRRVHSVPHRRNAVVQGIVNVRGELVISISLAEVLGSEAAGSAGGTAGNQRRLLVIGREDQRVAFEVDEVHGVHSYRENDRSAVPATIGKSAAALTTFIVAWQGRTVGCLEPTMLLDMIDRSMA